MKRIVSMVMAVMLLCGLLTVGSLAAAPEALNSAQALKSLGLFKGSDKGLELDRAPTRMESVIMLIRLMGKENEALSGEWSHPFTDAPTWQNAEAYLGYAYEKGLTTGVSATTFDPGATAGVREISTLTLRALGYTDGADSTLWDSWDAISSEIGLIPQEVNRQSFMRGDAAMVYYSALDCKIAGDATTLSAQLIADGVFTQAQLDTARLIAQDKVNLETSSLTDIIAATYAGVEGEFDLMRVVNTEITADNVQYYLGTDSFKFTEGLASEPMMTAQAHSLCLVRAADGVDIEAAMTAIRDNVNPYKWICVGVDKENIRVVNSGNLILLVMNNSYADQLVESFMSLGK